MAAMSDSRFYLPVCIDPRDGARKDAELCHLRGSTVHGKQQHNTRTVHLNKANTVKELVL